jgi:hypothetical protein
MAVVWSPYYFDYVMPGAAAARAKLGEISAQRQASLADYRLLEQELLLTRSAGRHSTTPSPAPDGTELGPPA